MGKMSEAISAILEDYYDAWRVQDLDWLATYLPSDFCHTMHIPHAIYTDAGAVTERRQRSSVGAVTCRNASFCATT